jgi:hypothetical protein
MSGLKQLKERVERLLKVAGAKAEPRMILFQPDGTRYVVGPDGRRMPDDTPPGPTTKFFCGFFHDAI